MPNTFLLQSDAPQKILELVFARADALNGFWNLYIAVGLGVLGLMASGKPFTRTRRVKALLTVGFIAFAYSNYDVISATNLQRGALIEILKGSALYEPASHAMPPSPFALRLFHGALDLLVISIIWVVPWHWPENSKSVA